MLEPTQLKPPENKKPFNWGLVGSWLGGVIAVVIIGAVIYWCVKSEQKDAAATKEKEEVAKIEAKLTEKTERETLFSRIQQFVDKRVSGWEVVGVTEDGIYIDVLLQKDEKMQVITLIAKEFKDIDGVEQLHIYRARRLDGMRRNNNKLKEQHKTEGGEEALLMQKLEQEELESGDYEPPDPY